MLRRVDWLLVNDVSGKPIGPIGSTNILKDRRSHSHFGGSLKFRESTSTGLTACPYFRNT